MPVAKKRIVAALTARGENEKAAQADIELPDTVDLGQRSKLLKKLGINLADLLGGADPAASKQAGGLQEGTRGSTVGGKFSP